MFTNKRPTLLHLPDGSVALPGASFNLPREMIDHPSIKVWIRAGFITYVEEKITTAVKVAKVRKAKPDELISLSEKETDPVVLDAIHARAEELL